ncbi:hypothetical protein NE865_08149 [Phthorimaea operculella]|nr:hypothetical protein NE865_08149 [Phthorimaea operculella]
METDKPQESEFVFCNTVKVEIFEEEQEANSIMQNCSSLFTNAEVTTDPETGQPYCVLCFEQLQPENIMFHMVEVHKYRKIFFKCWNCEQIFHEKTELNHHKQTCEPQKHVKQKPTISNFIKEANEKYAPNVCPICLIELSEDLAVHLENEHKVPDVEPKGPTPTATCHLCKKVFKSRNTLGQHLKQVHESTKGSVPCPECDKRFAHYKLLSNHLRNVHPQGDNKHSCHECGKLYKNHQSLHQHLKTYHKKRQSAVSETSEASAPPAAYEKQTQTSDVIDEVYPQQSVAQASETSEAFRTDKAVFSQSMVGGGDELTGPRSALGSLDLQNSVTRQR